jgi:hypothetical protein
MFWWTDDDVMVNIDVTLWRKNGRHLGGKIVTSWRKDGNDWKDI